MSFSKTISPAEVDFWLDTDKYSNFLNLDPSNKSMVFSIDMIRLSSIRIAISNFVRILTRKNIPVFFNNCGNTSNINNKVIYISSKINNKVDFDVAVGQALHEGGHALLTDFDVIMIAYANIPHNIFQLSDSKNIRRSSLEKFIKNIWNVIEDRYIDNFVFNSSPGYRGYYAALYNRFWNCPEIGEYLVSDYFRYPSLKSYDFRITNFTNENTDLLALPCLDDIAEIIDISNIDRLHSTKDRMETAFKVTEVVLDCIDKQEKDIYSGTSNKKEFSNLLKPSDLLEFDDEDENKDENEDVDVSKKMIDEISEIMSGNNTHPQKLDENDKAVNKISNEDLGNDILEKNINNIIENQRKFINGEFPKEEITDTQKELLNLIEKHGIILVRVNLPTLLPDNTSLKIDCIVVQKMTRDLVLSGKDIFPLSGATKMGEIIPSPPEEVLDAVNRGIKLGEKLGQKLQIRNEINFIKSVRKKSGKINKRQLHEASFDADDLFYKTETEKHSKANLHITIDSSGSMGQGNKWEKTMTSVVAICKATSMVDNIHVTVSFRSTQKSLSTELPYIILAYDSEIDDFSKIKNLFPYLVPYGFTPEGLAFDATMDLFKNITPDEEDRYFLNLSDGEPYYVLRSPENGTTINYTNEVAISHTKYRIEKIRSCGVEVLSYFIQDKYDENDEHYVECMKSFKRMYGKNAKIIDVNSIIDIANTMNEFFLK